MDDDWNHVPACKECNSSKGGRTFTDWYKSNSTLRPQGAVGAIVASRFARYDREFRRNGMFVSMNGPFWNEWWEDLVKDVDSFLDRLQSRVDDKIARYDLLMRRTSSLSSCGSTSRRAFLGGTSSTSRRAGKKYSGRATRGGRGAKKYSGCMTVRRSDRLAKTSSRGRTTRDQ